MNTWWRPWKRRASAEMVMARALEDQATAQRHAREVIEHDVETLKTKLTNLTKTQSKLRTDLTRLRNEHLDAKEKAERWYGFDLSKDRGYLTVCEDVRKLMIAVTDIAGALEELQRTGTQNAKVNKLVKDMGSLKADVAVIRQQQNSQKPTRTEP